MFCGPRTTSTKSTFTRSNPSAQPTSTSSAFASLTAPMHSERPPSTGEHLVCYALPKRARSGLPQSIPAPRLRQPRAPGPGRGVPVPCSGGRDGSLLPTGNGPIGRGTCARPGLGALVADTLPGEGRLPKLSQSPQPLHGLFIHGLARRVRGGSRTETALAGQQVMLAAFVHDPEDTTEPVTPCPYLSLAFRMRPLSPFTGPDWDPPMIYSS
jgi:hypothetical protein